MIANIEGPPLISPAIAQTTANVEWANSWKIPVVAAIAIGVSMTPLYSLGALMPSIHASTGWTRSEISSGTMFLSGAALLFSPLVGTTVDRFGSRKVALPGLVVFSLALAGLSLAHGKVGSWLLCWAVLAACDVFVKVTVWTSAVVKNFSRARGFALGITLAGTGLGSTTIPYITTILQEHFGWRRTYEFLALGGFVIAFPLVVFFFRDGPGSNSQLGKMPVAIGSALPKARSSLLSRQYIQLICVCLLSVPAGAALAVHFVPILRSFGYAAHPAAATAGAAGIAVIIGRLAGGFLMDRFSGPLVGALSCGTATMVAPILLLSHRPAAGLVASILLGLSVGSEIGVFSYLVSRYFDIRRYGLFFGALNGIVTFGTGLGPLFAGYMFDRSGNYTRLLWISVPMFALSAVLLATLGKAPSASTVNAMETGTFGNRSQLQVTENL